MKSLRRVQTIALIAIFVFSIIYPITKTNADALTTISDTMSRMKDGENSNHNIVFVTPTGRLAASDTLTITFPTGFDVTGVDYSDIDVNATTTGELTLAAAADATSWGAAFVGNVLTFTHPTDGAVEDIPALATVTIEIGTNAIGGGANAQINNQTVAQNNTDPTIEIGGANNSPDTGSFAVEIVADDQVIVNTTIDPYITFAITTTTVNLTGEVGSGNPSPTDTGINEGAANTLAASTNAINGYGITYVGATLTSSAGTITAIGGTPASAGTPGTEQFGINLMENTNPVTGTTKTGDSDGVPEGDYDTIDEFAFEAGSTAIPLANSSTNPATTTTFTVAYAVNVSGETEPGVYTTTITYICTGNF